MSMREYPVDDYGLVFNGNHLNMLAAKLCEDYTDEDFDKNRYDYYDIVKDKLSLQSIPEFTGEALSVENDGITVWDDTQDIYIGDTIYYLNLSKYPTLFKVAYKNMNEIIDELKTKIGKYLPNDFPYRNFIRHIVGTYYG